jgi:hypothetical protein
MLKVNNSDRSVDCWCFPESHLFRILSFNLHGSDPSAQVNDGTNGSGCGISSVGNPILHVPMIFACFSEFMSDMSLLSGH